MDASAADCGVYPAGRCDCRDHREMMAFAIGLVAYIGALLLSLAFMRFASAITGGGWGPIEWTRSYYMLLLAAIAASAVLLSAVCAAAHLGGARRRLRQRS